MNETKIKSICIQRHKQRKHVVQGYFTPGVLFIYLFIYLFIVIYLDWVGQLQYNMYSTLEPSILK